MARRFSGAAFVLLGSASLLDGAPMLRLANTTVVPVPIPSGSNGGTQVVEAYNAGDGSLSLSIGAPVSWIVTTIGSPRTCTTTTAAATCIPLQMALNTSALAIGAYTAIVTVNDANPNTVDAPQTITVTVRIGGVNAYAAPGGSSDVSFSTHSSLTASPTTQDGGRWLSLALDGTGSFRFTYPYRIHVAPPASMAQGTYSGQLVTGGSSFAPDNQTIPVSLRVTTQAIAQPSPDHITARLAQGAAAISTGIALNDAGQGSLTVGTVAATTTDGGKWLTATGNSSGAAITLDAGTMAPGYYTGSVSLASNAGNGTVVVPVSFQVAAKGAPLANYMGVVDNAIYSSPVARGDIVDVFGEQFWFASSLAYSPGVPLATQITASGSSSSVLVNGRAAPLYFTSYGQIAFEVPLETAVGTAQIQVQRDGVSGNIISVQVVDRAPGILVIVKQDGNVPDSSHPSHVGDYLTIWAIGLGPTNPTVGTNVPAPGSEPLARVTTMPVVNFGMGIFGTLEATPTYAGLSPGSVGLYQVNVAVPPGVPSGMVNVSLAFPDGVSNIVQIAVQ